MSTLLEDVDLNGHVTIWPDRAPTESRDPVLIGDIVARVVATATTTPIRWEVIRSGDREPIIWPTRLAIGRRDDFTCRNCHTDLIDQPFELDHIVPWSAGGSDRSDNLRVLCVRCNQRRSNFRDHSKTATPVTWWCVQCWTDDNAFRYAAADNFRIAHKVSGPNVIAYCAHCRHTSQTDVTL